ncbi:MAG: hypothetical protein A2Y34_02575 [Spirochaetes bacterium GWC1_27_15]|nr:MAG: hypothetical protein A2Z98_15495 [Spirochaetes bacterium GWB1_27_13]OHD28047.1 MAG: hypothetical protein A2Y34_02575 [Spirochaetes bacterium GWC1_27_15]
MKKKIFILCIFFCLNIVIIYAIDVNITGKLITDNKNIKINNFTLNNDKIFKNNHILLSNFDLSKSIILEKTSGVQGEVLIESIEINNSNNNENIIINKIDYMEFNIGINDNKINKILLTLNVRVLTSDEKLLRLSTIENKVFDVKFYGNEGNELIREDKTNNKGDLFTYIDKSSYSYIEINNKNENLYKIEELKNINENIIEINPVKVFYFIIDDTSFDYFNIKYQGFDKEYFIDCTNDKNQNFKIIKKINNIYFNYKKKDNKENFIEFEQGNEDEMEYEFVITDKKKIEYQINTKTMKLNSNKISLKEIKLLNDDYYKTIIERKNKEKEKIIIEKDEIIVQKDSIINNEKLKNKYLYPSIFLFSTSGALFTSGITLGIISLGLFYNIYTTFHVKGGDSMDNGAILREKVYYEMYNTAIPIIGFTSIVFLAIAPLGFFGFIPFAKYLKHKKGATSISPIINKDNFGVIVSFKI